MLLTLLGANLADALLAAFDSMADAGPDGPRAQPRRTTGEGFRHGL
jgi:hypothetical protein